MEKAAVAIVGIAVTLTVIGMLIMAVSVVVEVLWDSIMPDIFGLPEITYWQAVRLLVLAYLLISGGSLVTTTRRESE